MMIKILKATLLSIVLLIACPLNAGGLSNMRMAEEIDSVNIYISSTLPYSFRGSYKEYIDTIITNPEAVISFYSLETKLKFVELLKSNFKGKSENSDFDAIAVIKVAYSTGISDVLILKDKLLIHKQSKQFIQSPKWIENLIYNVSKLNKE